MRQKLCISVLFWSLALGPAWGQSRPVLPARVHQIVVALYTRHTNLAQGTDDQRRQLTRYIIEQTVCEFPGDDYLGKSASPTRPFSKDSIARRVGAHMWGWDWQNGSTRQPMTYPNKPADHDITGQHPIPITCVNHLATPAPSDPTEPPTAPPDTPDTIAEQVAALYAEFQAFKLEVRQEWGEIEDREERIYAAERDAADGIRTSLEEHREEARQTRNKVFGFLTNWRNLATLAGGVIGGIVAQRQAQ